jgi:NAD(P)-dependent dehydrogenase (short-subunit alcohol dehydrogenase family)
MSEKGGNAVQRTAFPPFSDDRDFGEMKRQSRFISPNRNLHEKNMLDFKDKIILITGAGGGTGRTLADELAARGAAIAAVDINPLGLDETVARIRLAGGRVKDYVFDTAKRLPVVALVDEVLDDWGRIDILICTAEVHPTDPILTMDEWDFHRTLDVNLAGPFFLMQRVAQAMTKQGGGIMVVVESQEHGGAAFKISQIALVYLKYLAAQEFAAYNIQVIGIEDFRLMIEN